MIYNHVIIIDKYMVTFQYAYINNMRFIDFIFTLDLEAPNYNE